MVGGGGTAVVGRVGTVLSFLPKDSIILNLRSLLFFLPKATHQALLCSRQITILHDNGQPLNILLILPALSHTSHLLDLVSYCPIETILGSDCSPSPCCIDYLTLMVKQMEMG